MPQGCPPQALILNLARDLHLAHSSLVIIFLRFRRDHKLLQPLTRLLNHFQRLIVVQTLGRCLVDRLPSLRVIADPTLVVVLGRGGSSALTVLVRVKLRHGQIRVQ